MKKIAIVFLAIMASFVLMTGCGSGSKDSADTGDTDTDSGDTDTADTADTSDTDIAPADTGDSAADTGDHSDSTADTGDHSDTGDHGDSTADTGDSGKKQGELYGECYPNNTCNEGLVCDIENNTCIKDTAPDTGDSGDGKKQGELYGECYPNNTCNEGLVCDIENNTCIKDQTPADTGDSTDTGDTGDTAPADTGDSAPVTGDTRTVNCENLPANASWNTASSITQTWDGSDWIPTNSAIFSETPSTSKCFFKCAENYEWNNSTCVECASIGGTWNSSSSKCTRTQNCSSKPANTVWSTVSSITQTYNYDDETWEPSTTSSFNETGSTSQCRYKCASGYDWNGSLCIIIPECSASSGTPCKDSSTGYIWSAKASTTYTWQNAVDYCNSYSEVGLIDWHLPTITELRTLILNCPSTMPTGSCAVNDPGCLSLSCWTSATCPSCSQDSSGGHSKFGETEYFWSSSTRSGSTGYAWYVLFGYGDVYNRSKTNTSYVRCVR